MINEVILVKGNSVVAYDVLEKADYKKIENLTPNFPNRDFYEKNGEFFKISFPVWKGRSVRLDRFTN